MTIEGEFSMSGYAEHKDPHKEYDDARQDMIEATAGCVNDIHYGQIESIRRRLTAATDALSNQVYAFETAVPQVSLNGGSNSMRMHHTEHVNAGHTVGGVRRAARGGRAAQRL